MKDYYLHSGNWSFTFTIPSFKSIKYKSVNTKYGLLTQNQQYDFIENHLQDISTFHKGDIKWVYEEHKENDNRLHVHGFIINAIFEEVESFRNNFYASYKINCSRKSYVKYSDIQSTTYSIDYFKEYMQKHQHEIKYYMRVDIDKQHSDNLDKGVKLAKAIKIISRDEFETWPKEHKYLFGKDYINNNFVIDF